MTLPIYYTRDMEQSARALAARHSRVMLRAKTIAWAPIRLRRNKIADLNPYVVLTPSEFDRQLEEWNERGGVLLYERAYRRNEDVAAHHAQLVVECPLSMPELDAYLDGARECAVVYWPPRWDEHIRVVDDFFPDAERCQRFYELVRSCPSRPDVERALGRINFTMCSDEAAAKAMGLTTGQVGRVRRKVYRRRSIEMVTPVALRVEPGPEDPTLCEVYRYIETHYPETPDGLRLIVGESLGKAHRWWRVALRDLARRGAIEKRDTLFCYTEDALPPHWHRIQGEHVRAKQRLAEIIGFLQGCPAYSDSITRAA